MNKTGNRNRHERRQKHCGFVKDTGTSNTNDISKKCRKIYKLSFPSQIDKRSWRSTTHRIYYLIWPSISEAAIQKVGDGCFIYHPKVFDMRFHKEYVGTAD